ncbi:hypothetical protein ACE1CI_12505 [Aerosakkonemataceae cyanobacterium BLCC-F50]|uniref:Ribosomal protein L20 n=1 Tax=Floridaenema flaviceps BLCC-F50 TaxID=3153642 RepID=A0ABV4XPU7_9CYAN
MAVGTRHHKYFGQRLNLNHAVSLQLKILITELFLKIGDKKCDRILSKWEVRSHFNLSL